MSKSLEELREALFRECPWDVPARTVLADALTELGQLREDNARLKDALRPMQAAAGEMKLERDAAIQRAEKAENSTNLRVMAFRSIEKLEKERDALCAELEQAEQLLRGYLEGGYVVGVQDFLNRNASKEAP